MGNFYKNYWSLLHGKLYILVLDLSILEFCDDFQMFSSFPYNEDFYIKILLSFIKKSRRKKFRNNLANDLDLSISKEYELEIVIKTTYSCRKIAITRF